MEQAGGVAGDQLRTIIGRNSCPRPTRSRKVRNTMTELTTELIAGLETFIAETLR